VSSFKILLSAIIFGFTALLALEEPPKAKEKDRSKLLDGLGGDLLVYEVPESSGNDFTDANCYVLCDHPSGEALVIDAGSRSAPIALRRIEEAKLKLTLLVSTHFHGDHTGGNALILGKTQAKMVASLKEAGLITGEALTPADKKQLLTFPTPRVDVKAKQGDELKLGAHPVKVIELGGHSPGSICLYFPDEKLLFTGDVLFKGAIGRTGLPHGSKTADDLVRAIRSKLLALPDDTAVLPGHGPSTTLGAERSENPWLKPPPKPEKGDKGKTSGKAAGDGKKR
jgi:glyoxylase-like metal-dependent hydrolase (beta-lactamase superfamily II)